MKTCSKCKIEKDEIEYGKESRTYDGLRSQCKECFNAIRRKWLKNNAEKINEERREKYANDDHFRQLRKITDKKYTDSGRRRDLYKKNREKELARNKKYRENNKIKVSIYQAEYRSKNEAFVKELWRNYRNNNREKLNEKRRIQGAKDVLYLRDAYIRQVLVQQSNGLLLASEIPPELISNKRIVIHLKRYTKKHNYGK